MDTPPPLIAAGIRQFRHKKTREERMTERRMLVTDTAAHFKISTLEANAKVGRWLAEYEAGR